MSGRRGFALIDVVVALSIFVVGGLAILTQVRAGGARVLEAERRAAAVGVARSAMALLEAGLASERTLAGPPGEWLLEDPAGDGERRPAGLGAAVAGVWTVEVQLDPAPYTGLTLATVRVLPAEAESDADGGRGPTPAVAVLRQLVPLDGGAAAGSGPGFGGGP